MKLIRLQIGLVLLLQAAGVGAQSLLDTNLNTRPISLEECIRLALEHNLEIKIAKNNPLMAQFALKGSYGYYEPVLNLLGEHQYGRDDTTTRFSEAGYGSVDTYDFSGTLLSVSSETISETEGITESWNRTEGNSLLSAGSSISGRSPWGTIWSFGGGVSDRDIDAWNFNSANGAEVWRQTFPAPPSMGTNFNSYQNSVSSGLNIRDNDVGFRLVQPLLRDFLTDPERTQIKVNKEELRISEYALQEQVMQIVSRVEKAYYELIAARDSVKVAQDSLQLAYKLLEDTQQRVKVGVAVPLDEKQVESQVASGKAALNEAQRIQSFQGNLLKSLLTDDYRQWYNLVPLPTEQLIALPQFYDLGESWERGFEMRPDYNRLRTEVAKQGLIVKLQKNQRLPQLDFQGFIGQSMPDQNEIVSSSSSSDISDQLRFVRDARDSSRYQSTTSESTRPEYSVGLVFSMPLGGNLRQKANLKIARQRQLQLQQEVQLRHLDILVEIEDALRSVKSKYEQFVAFREARTFAEAALQAEQKKYENGKSTSFFVLDFQNRLTRARADELRALSDYNKALVDFYAAEGSTLEKNRVSIDYQ